jgi:hypothetical protein
MLPLCKPDADFGRRSRAGNQSTGGGTGCWPTTRMSRARCGRRRPGRSPQLLVLHLQVAGPPAGVLFWLIAITREVPPVALLGPEKPLAPASGSAQVYIRSARPGFWDGDTTACAAGWPHDRSPDGTASGSHGRRHRRLVSCTRIHEHVRRCQTVLARSRHDLLRHGPAVLARKLLDSGKEAEAKRWLGDIVREFPDSEQAKEAASLLRLIP